MPLFADAGRVAMKDYHGAARAEWLAELAAALDQARGLVNRVDSSAMESDEWVDLMLRIEAARLDIRALQLRGRRMRAEFEPEWSQLAGSEENRTGTD
jgi:hypothetical protein